MFKTKNILRTMVASVAVAAAAMAPSAYAAPAFEVDMQTLGLGTKANFVATELLGGSAARIVRDAMNPNLYTATGYIEYSSFKNGSNLVNNNVAQVNGEYGLYAEFTQKFICPGNLGAGTGNCGILSIVFDLYADAGDENTYGAATLGADPTITKVGFQHHLGFVTQVFAGTAGVDLLGGAYQNAISGFKLTADGEKFFVKPAPFYNISFSSFTNTGTGAACLPSCANPDIIAINEEHGNTVFAVIPEPGPLALLGLGMLGLVAARRNKKSA